MQLTTPQQESYEAAVRTVMEWLAMNCNPHAIVIISNVSAELLTSETTYATDEFLKD